LTHPAPRPERASKGHARRAAEILLDHKANDVVLMDLDGITDMTDFFVIASGTSDTHVRSVAEHVRTEMAAIGVEVAASEGESQGRWVVLDFVDFVVHVFHPSLREFYQLERLWGDAPVVALNR
jgi:ribosome-associated protein